VRILNARVGRLELGTLLHALTITRHRRLEARLVRGPNLGQEIAIITRRDFPMRLPVKVAREPARGFRWLNRRVRFLPAARQEFYPALT